MKTKLSNKDAQKLLDAIFAPAVPDDMPDNFPDTPVEKVGYAEHVLTLTLSNIGPALQRLGRLHRLLIIGERKEGEKLPDIITHNELRMALEKLLVVKEDVNEISDMLVEIFKATKPSAKEEV